MRAAAATQIETRQVPPLMLRASVESSTFNADRRTVDVTWTTGARVLRYDFWNDRTFLEELSLQPGHVRMDRINNGAPLLDSHAGFSLRSQIGVVEPGTAKLAGREGVATVRFSKRADVEPIVQDVRDEIVQNVSVGYRTYKLEKTDQVVGGVPVYRAVDWEPYEISFVPMGADDGAGTRSAGKQDTNACELIIPRAALVTDADRDRFLRLARARAR